MRFIISKDGEKGNENNYLSTRFIKLSCNRHYQFIHIRQILQTPCTKHTCPVDRTNNIHCVPNGAGCCDPLGEMNMMAVYATCGTWNTKKKRRNKINLTAFIIFIIRTSIWYIKIVIFCGMCNNYSPMLTMP